MGAGLLGVSGLGLPVLESGGGSARQDLSEGGAIPAGEVQESVEALIYLFLFLL